MEVVNSYCTSAVNGTLSSLHKAYHDTQYGFKARNDNELFGSLILEINQAGLSWDTILNKKDSIRKAYADFNIEVIATFTDDDIETLMGDPGIIRMRGKITAIIHNANQIPFEFYKMTNVYSAYIDSLYLFMNSSTMASTSATLPS